MRGRVAYSTLGCKLNYAETSTYEREFIREGFETARPGSPDVDIYVINSCSVTEHADKKCRNLIRRFHKASPNAVIAVTGCYAELKPDEIRALEAVVLVVGSASKSSFVKRTIAAFESKGTLQNIDDEPVFRAYSSGERTRCFLKVQDGCDYKCAYCTVPLARGSSRNIPVCELVSQARTIAASGIKEIVLTGVNTGDFGKTTGESFLHLIKELDKVEGIERYRISSIEPNLLTEEIIQWIAEKDADGRMVHKFLPHFHIPIQSGCDKTLRAMHRRYTAAMFEDKISLIRDYMESPRERYTRVFFGIDVIVGFPGETDEDFEETYSLLERIRPAFLHIFPYSRRKNTEAAGRPDQVQDSIKTSRAERLEELCERLHSDFCKANEGRTLPVLFESKCKGGLMSGYTDNYIQIERPYDDSLVGRVVEIRL